VVRLKSDSAGMTVRCVVGKTDGYALPE
jgi:hypothetical protein